MKYNIGNKLCLSKIIDLYDLSILSYRYSNRNNNQLVEETMRSAFAANPRVKPIIHSDRGYKYTSYLYHGSMEECLFVQSMPRAGFCLDN